MTPLSIQRALRGLLGPSLETREQVRDYQAACLRPLIKHAWKNIPYYRRLLTAAGVHPSDIRTVDDLAAIPASRRSDLQMLEPRDICAPGWMHKTSLVEKTSGSSGMPLTIRRTWSEQNLLLAFRARAMKQWGQTLDTRRAIIDHFNDQAIAQGARPRMYERVGLMPRLNLDWRLPKNELVQKISAFRPDIISGPPSLLADLAGRLTAADRSALDSARHLSCGGEQLFPTDRKTIETGFGKPLCNRYGCSEVIYIATELPEQSGYRVCDEAIIIEVLDNGRPSNQGEIHITSLHQWSMPFIRYRLGDLVELKDHDGPHTWLKSIDGRVTDRFELPDGHRIHGYTLGECIEDSSLPVRRFQVTQEERDFFRIRLVLEGSPAADFAGLSRRIESVLAGRARFRIESIESLDRPNRKFYPFISLERFRASSQLLRCS